MRLRLPLIVAGLAAFSSLALAGPPPSLKLMPGEKAPKLEVKRWFKGKPQPATLGRGVKVVEFWATWCGPCRDAIPHLTKLAKANKSVTFIGISIWEDYEDKNIDKFIAEMGSKMDYNIGWSGNQTGMAESWMKPAAAAGIPTAFLIKDGVIQWIGHPMSLDAPLAAVLKGRHNVAKARDEYIKEVSASILQMELAGKVEASVKEFLEGDRAKAKADLGAIKSPDQYLQRMIDDTRQMFEAIEDPEGFGKKADALLAGKKAEDEQRLAGLAYRMAGNEKSRTFGVALADRVFGASPQDPVALFYCAYVHSKFGSKDKAREIALQAIKVIDARKDKEMEGFKKNFDQFLKPEKGSSAS